MFLLLFVVSLSFSLPLSLPLSQSNGKSPWGRVKNVPPIIIPVRKENYVQCTLEIFKLWLSTHTIYNVTDFRCKECCGIRAQSRSCATVTSIHSQNSSYLAKLKLPIKIPHQTGIPILRTAAPGAHPPTFCLCQRDPSGNFTGVVSHNMCPFVTGLFHSA